MKGEVKTILKRKEKRAKSVQKSKVSNIVIMSDSDDTKEKIYSALMQNKY